MKKSFVLLLLLAAVLFFSCSEALAATPEFPLTGVKITNHGLVNYDYIYGTSTLTPPNADGEIRYTWTTSDPSIAYINAPFNHDVRVYPGSREGVVTISLTVTQWIGEEKVGEATDSITDHSSNYGFSWSDMVGCNAAAGTWYALIMSAALLFFIGNRSKVKRNKS